MYTRLKVGDLEMGKANEKILEEVRDHMLKYVEDKKYNKSEGINVFFLYSGYGRAEIYLTEQLIKKGYRINKLCFMDQLYDPQSLPKRTNDKDLMNFLRSVSGSKELANDIKFPSSLEKIKSIFETHLNYAKHYAKLKIKCDKEDIHAEYGIHLIIGVHSQFGLSPKSVQTQREIDNYLDGLKKIGIPVGDILIYGNTGRKIIKYTTPYFEVSRRKREQPKPRTTQITPLTHVQIQQGGSYEHKYIKYKKKYLKLKNKK